MIIFLSVLLSIASCQSPRSLTSSPTVVEANSASPTSESNDPVLSIRSQNKTFTFTVKELLHHPAAQQLTLDHEGAYPKIRITVQAIPLAALFKDISINKGQTVEFDTLDGFSSSLDPQLLLNTDPHQATAYLAIEDPDHPWPALSKSGKSAGPLYLVWKNPSQSHIGQEQWPYQLRSFSVKEPLSHRFPKLQPARQLPPNAPERRGYHLFIKHCFACHTLNGEGGAQMGPDLNLPHSPTEYLKEPYLRLLIRNPQNLRNWKGSKMSSFSIKALPEDDLNDLLTYLKHMAAQRRSTQES